jgi:hypothetical protein
MVSRSRLLLSTTRDGYHTNARARDEAHGYGALVGGGGADKPQRTRSLLCLVVRWEPPNPLSERGSSLRTQTKRRLGVAAFATSVCLALAVPGLASAIRPTLGSAAALQAKSAANSAALNHVTHDESYGSTHCFGLIPYSGANSYQQDCYGHDEPAIDPISSVPGSAQDITWTIKLPRSSAQRSLLDMGPTFWIGATLNDPSSLANSVFSELQFYPDSSLLPQSGNDINTACESDGFNVNPDPGTWSICDFSWGLYPNQGFAETAAYVSVVDRTGHPDQALYLHSGDRIRVHIFNSGDAYNDAEQVITDLTTGQSGSLIMYSNATTGAGSSQNPGVGDGPLSLPDSTNTTDNAMPWGVVDGTPFAFSWEIGHSNIYTHATQGECVPGQWDCYSYDTSNNGWGATSPLEIQSVTFNVGGNTVQPSSWATNDSQGGAAEDNQWCGSFNTPGTHKCSFPYYTYSPSEHAILFGTTNPGTPSQYTYGQAPAEYAQTATCTGPLTTEFNFLYYCSNTLNPSPPIT